MYAGRDFDPMDAGVDADVFTLDFVNDLAAGETITGSPAVTLAVVNGIDAAAASRLSGSPSVSGTKVSQLVDVRGGPGGVYYRLTAVVATPTRPAVALWSHFWSRNPD